MKKTSLKSILILAALSIVTGATGVVRAQAAQETPESVAKAYLAAKQAADWAKVASLTHPEALAEMKSAFASILSADKSGEAASAIFKLKSGAEFSQLSEAAVFERSMDFAESGDPDMKTILASANNTILGKVDEGPDLVHVLYRFRAKIGTEEINKINLISLKKQGSTWRALLTPDIEDMLDQLLDSTAPPEGNGAPPDAGRPPRRP
jgi:hypothetical protein